METIIKLNPAQRLTLEIAILQNIKITENILASDTEIEDAETERDKRTLKMMNKHLKEEIANLKSILKQIDSQKLFT
ncbi:hypothetical protein RZR97_00735 [Hydrogenimonas thermophila]|uniref:hypothetical protein n=1 Tax=Hydrogenimonas thermophila TaxID=223786 RepID=UPI002936F6C4|nr:hypothetical protein [Hydrogenimonas thermophila]WOE70121.1 hypothetical protein RZR91_00735 [Hydrogenimonas thermophila]WOE72638.1 hypothetical protein RZR97_00735 [Hydrogenimonas thermophila]